MSLADSVNDVKVENKNGTSLFPAPPSSDGAIVDSRFSSMVGWETRPGARLADGTGSAPGRCGPRMG